MANSLKNGVLPPDYRELIYGGRTKGGWQTGLVEPARTGRPPPVLPQRKGTQGSNEL